MNPDSVRLVLARLADAAGSTAIAPPGTPGCDRALVPTGLASSRTYITNARTK